MTLMSVMVLALSAHGPFYMKKQPFSHYWECVREARVLTIHARQLFGKQAKVSCALTGAPVTSPRPHHGPLMSSPLPASRPSH